jgi:hypothetical protein
MTRGFSVHKVAAKSSDELTTCVPPPRRGEVGMRDAERVWTAPLVQGLREQNSMRCGCGRVSGLFVAAPAAGPDGFRDPLPNG